MNNLSEITKEEIKLCEIFHSGKRSREELVEFAQLNDAGDKEKFLAFLRKYSDQVSKVIDEDDAPIDSAEREEIILCKHFRRGIFPAGIIQIFSELSDPKNFDREPFLKFLRIHTDPNWRHLYKGVDFEDDSAVKKRWEEINAGTYEIPDSTESMMHRFKNFIKIILNPFP